MYRGNSADFDDAGGDGGEAFEFEWVVAGDDEAGVGGEGAHAVLRAEVGVGVEGLGDGFVLVEVAVEIHVVGCEHDGAGGGGHGDELRGEGVLAAGVGADAGEDELVVAVDEGDAAGDVELDEGEDVVGVDAAVGARGLPGGAGVVGVLVLLQPDAGVGEEVHAVGVVPVHVGEDDVGDVGGLEAEFGEGLVGGLEVADGPGFEELRAVEAGVDEDGVAVAADEPVDHGDVDLLGFVGAGDEAGERESGDRGVADGVDGVAGGVGVCGLGTEGGREEEGECDAEAEGLAHAATISQRGGEAVWWELRG